MRSRTCSFLPVLPALLVWISLEVLGHAQTVTVTTSADVSDISSSAMIPDLPGPDGVVSLREALLVTDNTAGQQTIGFAIPVSDWYLPTIYPGLCLLQGSTSWRAFDAVTLDGTTQTAFTGDTNPDGNELVLYGLTLTLNGDGSQLFGFHGSNIGVAGSNCIIRDNTGKSTIDVYNGAGSTIHDNDAGTIDISYSSDNIVVGNVAERVRISGGGAWIATNNRIGGPDPSDRNYITGWGNYGEHGVPSGTTVDILGTIGTVIENNYIGTTPDGMSIGNPASTIGLSIDSDNLDVVVRDNLVAVQATHALGGEYYSLGIYIGGEGNGIDLFGNSIGLNALGETVLGSFDGIVVDTGTFETPEDVQIGGTLPGEANRIAGHSGAGVVVKKSLQTPPQGIRITGNSIREVGGIGIDLLPNNWTFGPTPNDPLDADAGGNGLQNYPVIRSVTPAGASTRVIGSLHSSPSSSFTLEFFASAACGVSGFGPGEVFLDAVSVTTDAAGNTDFDVLVGAPVAPGWFITSTATLEPLGATSEFSACVPVAGVWSDLGGGLAGAHGTPLLMGTGTLAPGTGVTLTLTGALENAPLALILGFSRIDAPFRGGSLVPQPDLILPGLRTDAAGGSVLSGTWASGLPSGTEVYLQEWILDPVAPFGMSASNGLRAVSP